jgi:4-hydroxy-tetrahydrodipicolinate reductase
MGRTVTRVAAASGVLKVVGAVERPGHPELGRDAGLAAGLEELGVAVTDDFAAAVREAGAYIDFAAPESVVERLEQARALGAGSRPAAVIGSTGLTAQDQARLAEAARDLPVLWSPNMSLGVNLMFKIAALMAAGLGPQFDAEIVEIHHRLKKDAPSGTALKLQQTVAHAKGLDPAGALVSGRSGLVGARADEEIGVLAVRAGDVVGDHTLIFAGPGERLELTHRAHSRDTFAAGAVRAAAWLIGRPPGLYSLGDVLGL